MVGGEVVASRYATTHNTLHTVLNQMIQNSLAGQDIDEGVCVDDSSGPMLSSSANLHDSSVSVAKTGVCTEVLVVCGTLYAMPHVRRSLGIFEPK
jgi:hypothetical protein